MNKAELIKSVNVRLDTKYGRKEERAADFVEAALETIGEKLAKGEKVTLAGFGNFEPEDKPARTGRNPRTGESIQIAARRVVKFSPAKGLRDKINA